VKSRCLMEVRFIVYGNSARQNAPLPALLLNFFGR
jgi:hypothetical protein